MFISIVLNYEINTFPKKNNSHFYNNLNFDIQTQKKNISFHRFRYSSGDEHIEKLKMPPLNIESIRDCAVT